MAAPSSNRNDVSANMRSKHPYAAVLQNSTPRKGQISNAQRPHTGVDVLDASAPETTTKSRLKTPQTRQAQPPKQPYQSKHFKPSKDFPHPIDISDISDISDTEHPGMLPLYRDDSESEAETPGNSAVSPPSPVDDLKPLGRPPHPICTVIGDLAPDGQTGLVVDTAPRSKPSGLRHLHSTNPSTGQTSNCTAGPAWVVYRGGSSGYHGVCTTETEFTNAIQGNRNNTAYKKFPSLAVAQQSYQECLETGVIALINQTDWQPKEKFMILQGIRPGICQGRQGLLHRLGYRGGTVVRITNTTDAGAQKHFEEYQHMVEKLNLPPLA